jgi:uncharacterized protein (DUF2384 family)
MNTAKLFGNVPTDSMHFYHDGHLDYEKVVRTLNLKKADISAATNIKEPSIRYDSKMPKDLEQRLLEWATAINLVAEFFNDPNKTMIWFKTPNPQLGDMSPRDMIRIGRFKKLFSFIQSALNDNKE